MTHPSRGQGGNVEIDRSKLVERAVFSLRCVGEFDVRWGVGAYGKGLNACLMGDVALWKGRGVGIWSSMFNQQPDGVWAVRAQNRNLQ